MQGCSSQLTWNMYFQLLHLHLGLLDLRGPDLALVQTWLAVPFRNRHEVSCRSRELLRLEEEEGRESRQVRLRVHTDLLAGRRRRAGPWQHPPGPRHHYHDHIYRGLHVNKTLSRHSLDSAASWELECSPPPRLWSECCLETSHVAVCTPGTSVVSRCKEETWISCGLSFSHIWARGTWSGTGTVWGPL